MHKYRYHKSQGFLSHALSTVLMLALLLTWSITAQRMAGQGWPHRQSLVGRGEWWALGILDVLGHLSMQSDIKLLHPTSAPLC
jgi:hypothetical protein